MGNVDRTPQSIDRAVAAVRRILSGALADGKYIVANGDNSTYTIYLVPSNTPGVSIEANGGTGPGLGVKLQANGGLSNLNALGSFAGLLVKGDRVVSADPSFNLTDGDTWYNSTSQAFVGRQSGLSVPRVGLLYADSSNSTTLGNTATNQGFTTHTFSIPANFLVVGRVLRMRVFGRYIASGATTLTLQMFMTNTSVLSFGAITPSASAVSRAWQADLVMTVASTGVSGNVRAHGGLNMFFNGQVLPSTSVGSTLDTTVALTPRMTAQWSAANAADGISSVGYTLEVLA